MAPQFPTVPPEHPDRVLYQSSRPRLRHALTGVALAAAFAFAGIATRGDARQVTTAQSVAPSTGHAQVIAQGIFDLSDGPLTWSMATVEAEAQQTDLAAEGISGFALGTNGDVTITGANARTRLAGGEALVVRPDDYLTMRAAGPDPASVSLLTLSPAEPTGLGDVTQTGETFASPGGSRDVEFVGDVLAEGESAEIPAAAAPIFVLVTEGSLAIAVDEDETLIVQAGDTALIPGDLVVTGSAEEQTRFAAAVIGADVDAESADRGRRDVNHAPLAESAPVATPFRLPEALTLAVTVTLSIPVSVAVRRGAERRPRQRWPRQRDGGRAWFRPARPRHRLRPAQGRRGIPHVYHRAHASGH